MTPLKSGYLDAVSTEDFETLAQLSLTSIALTEIIAAHCEDIRKRFIVSTTWCHLTCRVVAAVFSDKKLTVVDGRVYDLVLEEEGAKLTHTTHSWCLTPSGSILDLAPVGIVAFTPLLFAKKEGVKRTEWGFVTNRYCETNKASQEVAEALASEKYIRSFPVYVSLLREARKKASKRWGLDKK